MATVGKSLIRAAKEAAAIARGDKKPARIFVPSDIDVKEIRRNLQLTQDDFASEFGFTVNQIRDWEQRRTRPTGGARAYLLLIESEPERIRELLAAYRDRDDVDAILITGGTGISRRDRTFDVVNEMLTTPLPGYGELFRMLSYEQVGAAAMLSRATGGLMDRKVLLTMPGSPAAVQLAMSKIILKELAHLVREARR